MPRAIRDAKLDTEAARLRLKPRKKPYYRLIAAGLHLGYYAGEQKARDGGDRVRRGVWIARRYLGDGAYETERLALADDRSPADGQQVMTFAQAQEAARTWDQKHRAAPGTAPLPSVRDALAAYSDTRKQRAARAGKDAEARLERHVPADDPLAALPLDKVSAEALAAWRSRRLSALKPATANRLMNDLRAALNGAGRLHRRNLPTGFELEIREGLKGIADATTARKQILNDADVRRVLEGAMAIDPEGDFGRLVLVLAGTGCRFGQAAKLTVADVQVAQARIMVPASAKGRAGRSKPPIAIPVGSDVIDALRPAMAGRGGHEPLLMRWLHKRAPVTPQNAGRIEWIRDRREPWRVGADMARPWDEAIAAARLPAGIVPYALRHTSIVRALTKGLPLRLVAAMHDTSVAMIEKHYAAYIVDATEELMRNAITPLAPTQPARLRAV
ncbi:tyrosine-type recombinase/integrase [Elioraea rosea]|uniref:tyrosine-type recombinase/integrase n=1 Tax=Elioraea rosea TaxID=2492390 RepID=UPI00118409B3|nr:tyrosine-type recombinase/integrase [Elioraea rosea]